MEERDSHGPIVPPRRAGVMPLPPRSRGLVGSSLISALYLARRLNITSTEIPRMSNPVNRLVIYRPKAGSHDQLLAILRQHGPTLRKTGLITDEPVRLFGATDLRRDGSPEPYFIETFQWKDAQAADVAHQTPEVMAVWETMGPHLAGMTLTTLAPLT
jgi:hypothetical protein